MSDRLRTFLEGVQGPVHTGLGDQYNLSFLTNARGQTPRAVAESHVCWLRQRFVPPLGLGRARELLLSNGIVMLCAPPGSGRNVAAHMLLYELAEKGGAFQELIPDPGEKGPLLPPDLVGQGDRLLLDLSAGEPQLWTAVQAELGPFQDTLRKNAAHLAVVPPHPLAHQHSNGLQRFCADLRRPPATALLRRYLRLGGIGTEAGGHLPEIVLSYLDRTPPLRDVAALAHYILRARAASHGSDGFEQWCWQAFRAVTNQEQEVANRVASLREGPQRALLLTTAMLDGAHADAVHLGTEQLLRTAQHPPGEAPLLEQDDLAQRFESIDATTGADGKVRFRELGWPEAVRTHFWTTMPDLRPRLRVWVEGAIGLPDLTMEDRDGLVERFAVQCLRTKRSGDLISLVEHWTASPKDGIRLRAAAQALEHGLTSKEWGSSFRQKIYTWAYERRLSEGLFTVLVEVCSEVIAVRHPDQAMVRLHHLSRQEVSPGIAREALVQLVRADHRAQRRLLDQLSRALEHTHWPTDRDLFAATADPCLLTDPGTRAHALLTEPGVRHHLTVCWNLLFRKHPPHTWTPLVGHWLSAATNDEDHGELLLRILVEATDKSSGLLSRLYLTGRDWSRASRAAEERTRRASTAKRLLHMIDAAQGLRSG
ncbi:MULTISPECIES: hypothetical protein [Streptomyces]|uniref:hypothetical protein n=1 Tax=Streptomyces TaxID=1883 RepID=UPI00345C3DBC